jgi:hypothetical protein
MIRFAITPLSVIRSIGPPTINDTRLVTKQEDQKVVIVTGRSSGIELEFAIVY